MFKHHTVRVTENQEEFALIHSTACLPLAHLRGKEAVLPTGEETLFSHKSLCSIIRQCTNLSITLHDQEGTKHHFRSEFRKTYRHGKT